MLKASKIPINIGDMVRLAPEIIPLYLNDITMYEGDKTPCENGTWSAMKKHRFRPEDTGLVISMVKYEHAEHEFYLKLITSSGLVGWVYSDNLVLC